MKISNLRFASGGPEFAGMVVRVLEPTLFAPEDIFKAASYGHVNQYSLTGSEPYSPGDRLMMTYEIPEDTPTQKLIDDLKIVMPHDGTTYVTRAAKCLELATYEEHSLGFGFQGQVLALGEEFAKTGEYSSVAYRRIYKGEIRLELSLFQVPKFKGQHVLLVFELE
ncbi:hypothetical protein H7X65_01620 [Candidatus Parcubacteria bacterium]|nr:hypothetical protein [Candidatus Parcubacteria bacterium]